MPDHSAGLSTEGADPSLPGLNPCHLGLFLSCLQIGSQSGKPTCHKVAGPSSATLARVTARLGSRKDHHPWVLIAEDVVFGLDVKAQGPGFILLSAAWLWPELRAFTRTPLKTRPIVSGGCLLPEKRQPGQQQEHRHLEKVLLQDDKNQTELPGKPGGGWGRQEGEREREEKGTKNGVRVVCTRPEQLVREEGKCVFLHLVYESDRHWRAFMGPHRIPAEPYGLFRSPGRLHMCFVW